MDRYVALVEAGVIHFYFPDNTNFGTVKEMCHWMGLPIDESAKILKALLSERVTDSYNRMKTIGFPNGLRFCDPLCPNQIEAFVKDAHVILRN